MEKLLLIVPDNIKILVKTRTLKDENERNAPILKRSMIAFPKLHSAVRCFMLTTLFALC